MCLPAGKLWLFVFTNQRSEKHKVNPFTHTTAEHTVMNDNVSVTLEEVFRNSGSPLDRKRGGDQADIVQFYLFISQIVRVPDCIQT